MSLLGAGAIGLCVRNDDALSLRIPAGWHVVVAAATPQPNAGRGRLSLAGPAGATFDLFWSVPGVAYSCAGACDAGPLKPVDATFDGRPLILSPWPGGSHGSLVAGSLEHDVAGHPLYFNVECRPASATDEAACAHIVSSIGWSAPLFAHLRPDMVVVAVP